METSLDHLRSRVSTKRATSRRQALRLGISALALAGATVLGGSLQDTSASTLGSVAYCVTTPGGSAVPAGLHTALIAEGDSTRSLYAISRTGYNGCGVFNYVPVDQSFFVSAWSEDGAEAGNSSLFRSDAMVIAPAVELSAQPAQDTAWWDVITSQANRDVQ